MKWVQLHRSHSPTDALAIRQVNNISKKKKTLMLQNSISNRQKLIGHIRGRPLITSITFNF